MAQRRHSTRDLRPPAFTVAIEHIGARPNLTVEEVFTGRPLADTWSAPPDDDSSRQSQGMQQDWASRPVAGPVVVIRCYRDLIA